MHTWEICIQQCRKVSFISSKEIIIFLFISPIHKFFFFHSFWWQLYLLSVSLSPFILLSLPLFLPLYNQFIHPWKANRVELRWMDDDCHTTFSLLFFQTILHKIFMGNWGEFIRRLLLLFKFIIPFLKLTPLNSYKKSLLGKRNKYFSYGMIHLFRNKKEKKFPTHEWWLRSIHNDRIHIEWWQIEFDIVKVILFLIVINSFEW